MTGVQTDVAIVGAGLSGLAVADALSRAGRDFQIFEARDRVGGRVLSRAEAGGRFDLGPAWIWPHNTRMLHLADRLGLGVHRQYSAGNLVFEAPDGRIQRDLAFATMGDGLRIAGGLSAMTEGLAASLDAARLHLSHTVNHIALGDTSIRLTGSAPNTELNVEARQVVLALPPRLVAKRVSVSPPTGDTVLSALSSVPTWMAGHAKLVAIYDEAHWRTVGLSGDAISHKGPLMEIHDATDESRGVPALFGFVNPNRSLDDARTVEQEALRQLERLFGPMAGRPRTVLFKNWSIDPNTAAPQDRFPPPGHPAYGLPPAVETWLDPRLIFAGTEAATQHGGFLEGALEAAENTISRVTDDTPTMGVRS